MTDPTTALARTTHLPETLAELFQPIRLETFGDLLLAYQADLATMTGLAGSVGEAQRGVLQYFARGNGMEGSDGVVNTLFGLEGAAKALDSEYWSRAMALTDVWDAMPAARKHEWNAMVSDLSKVPTFDAPSLQATFAGLLADRSKFFAERVDGVFRALSPDHKTNRPQGFRGKLIIASVMTGAGRFAYPEHRNVEYLVDLRKVVGAFMGRGEADYSSTSALVRWARDGHRGEWVWVDGNSWALRMYANGNAHVRLHEEMVWRLNNVLAYLYPQALAAEALVRPVKRPKVQLADRVIAFPVVRALDGDISQPSQGGWAVHWGRRGLAKHHARELAGVLEAVGGTAHSTWATFDYDPRPVLAELAATGTLPDHVLHQFYPTPTTIAARVVELADIQPGHTVLEPSAGTGNLARLVPVGAGLTCVEIAPLNCLVLQHRVTRAYVVEGDFLDTEAGEMDGQFDRVVMNPPFKGQWRAHLAAAAECLAPGGVLVSVLPSGADGNVDLAGEYAVTYHDRFDDRFPGASVDVVLVRVVRLS